MKTDGHVDEADAHLEEAGLVLEEMARELRRMKRKTRKTKIPADVPTSAAGGMAEIRVGQRVQVVRKDQYHRRTGVVLGCHGRLFWDVRLDASATQGASAIYKKEASLCAIAPTE
jgi:hypothetical protein